MDWKALAALGVLVIALAVWLAISIVTSVNRYARRFTEEPEDKRRGFEVKLTEEEITPAGTTPAVQREKDDHHG
jgi:hypothetical protein